MDTRTCFSILRQIRDCSFATVAPDGTPRSRIIDVMLAEDDRLYFLTARGKDFYSELMSTGRVAVSGLNDKWETVRVWGRVKNVGQDLLGRIFEEKSSKVYDNGLKYEVVDQDEADVAPAYTTEGRLVETDKFVLLEDDKGMWPPYNLAPVVRDEVLAEYPDIADILNAVSATLDTETVTALNARVDIDKEDYADVAADYFAGLS